MRSFLVRVAGVCIAVVLSTGACAGGCCESAEVANYEHAERSAKLHEMDTYVYERPIAEAWPDIASVLAEFGYTLAEKTPVEGRTLETSFKPASYGEYRMLVRVARLDAKRWRINFDRQYKSTDADGGTHVEIEAKNAGDMEAVEIAWRVAERVEPARALEMDKRVKAKAERAGAAGRGCDKGCAMCASLVPDPPQR
ncbi:MAG TPA: hypothetical protein VIF62_32265 [Labilithrix sp.]